MPITLAVVAVCSLLFLLPDTVQAALALDRHALGAGEFWRLWSGHFVHFDLRHAAFDLATLGLVASVAEREWGRRPTMAIYALAPALISLGTLGIAEDLYLYRGSSGLAALFGVGAAIALWGRGRRVRPVIVGLAFVAVLKCLIDATAAGVGATGVIVAWQAHVLGGALGAALALGMAVGHRPVATTTRGSGERPDTRLRIGSVRDAHAPHAIDTGR